MSEEENPEKWDDDISFRTSEAGEEELELEWENKDGGVEVTGEIKVYDNEDDPGIDGIWVGDVFHACEFEFECTDAD